MNKMAKLGWGKDTLYDHSSRENERKENMYTAPLRWRPVAILLVLALIWGANWATVKIGSRELPPLFMAGFRSLAASLCLFLWMKEKRISLFPSKKVALHGVVSL